MKKTYSALMLLGSLLLSATAASQDCNRDCLAAHLNTYLAAVA